MSSIVQTQTTSFKKELYQAVHDFTTDTFKIALYTASADLNEATTVYSVTNEVTGGGYVAGGIALTGVTIDSDGYTAYQGKQIGVGVGLWLRQNIQLFPRNHAI